MRCTEIKLNSLGLIEKELAVLGQYHDIEYIKTEAALCAWEHLLETRENFDDLNGVGQARMCCTSLGYAIHIGYCIANVDDRLDGYAYDWDFVPWFIDNCVVWETADATLRGEPLLRDDWVDLCRKCFEPEPEPSDEELLKICLRAFNCLSNTQLPGQVGAACTYEIAAKIGRRLQK